MNKLIIGLLFISFSSYSQEKKPSKKDFTLWGNAVVNLECQGNTYPKYVIDSIIKSYTIKGASKIQLDSISKILYTAKAFTGSGIYVSDGEKRYLITAKHVLLDRVLGLQKAYETKTRIANWSGNMESIYSIILIRTPLAFNLKNRKANSMYVTNNNFINEPNARPYIFIPDSTGDDIAILSLQEKNYKTLDRTLKEDGYIPIPIKMISTASPVEVGDEIFTVGFPEGVSTTSITTLVDDKNIIPLVSPFTTFGKVAMNDEALNFFYVDITIIYGNSGGPLIDDNKLVGIVSGINLYQISTDATSNILQGHLSGIGHFVKIIKTTNLIRYLRILQDREKNWQ